MDEKTNSGLSDETVDQFGEFMKMIEGFYQDLFEIETDDTLYLEYIYPGPSAQAEIIGDYYPQEIRPGVFKAVRK